MKSIFTFSAKYENTFDSFHDLKVWIDDTKEEENADLPLMDLGIDVTLSRWIYFCDIEDDDVSKWVHIPVRICGTIVARRLVVDSFGGSKMYYTIEPNAMSHEEIMNAIRRENTKK